MSSPGLTSPGTGAEMRSPAGLLSLPSGVAAAHEELDRRLPGDLPEGVAELLERPGHLFTLRGRRLYAREHPAVVGAVIAVVEESDVPARVQALEEPE